MNQTVEATESSAEGVSPEDTQSVESTESVETAEKADEAAEESTTPEDAKEEKPKKGGFQRRIEKLTKEKYEQANELETMRRQLETLQQQQIQQQVQQSGDNFPKLGDYGYDEGQYQQAVHAWSQQQDQLRQQAYQQHQQQQAAVQAEQQQAIRIREKLQNAQQKYPDFLMKIQNPELPSIADINQVAYSAVIESDQFADIANYLASNPAEIYKFSGLDPMSTLREVFKLEQKFSAKPQSSNTAPPPPPTKVSGVSESVKDPRDMTTEEFMAWRNSKRG